MTEDVTAHARRLLASHAARQTDAGAFRMCECDLCERAIRVIDRERDKWQAKRK